MGEGCVRTDVVGLSVRGGTVAFTLSERGSCGRLLSRGPRSDFGSNRI